MNLITPHIGEFFIIISIICNIFLIINPKKQLYYSSFFCVLISFLILTFLHLQDSFNVLSVFLTSHSSIPILYKIIGIWGSYDGSLLLFALLISFCPILISKYNNDFTLKSFGFVLSGLLSVILFSSNPFLQLTISPERGLDLNPLLQDPHMASHPPSLYFGYALTSLVTIVGFPKELKCLHIKIIKYTWSFLTLGIVLGSRWAYYELGWGGFWFWDPVENISLLPWILVTLLLHINSYKYNTDFSNKTSYLTSMIVFPVSMMGMFLSRSSTLQSVHTFGVDYKKSIFLLCFFIIITIYFLFNGLKYLKKHSEHDLKEFSINKGTLILISFSSFFIFIFVVILLSLIIGSLNSKINFSPEFYNQLFLPAILLILPFMIMIFNGNKLLKSILSFIFSISFIYLFFSVEEILNSKFISVSLLISMFTAVYILISFIFNYKNFEKWPVHFSHLGVSLALFGALSSHFESENFYSIQKGDQFNFIGKTFKVISSEESKEANYNATIVNIRDISTKKLLSPERRYFWTQKKTHYEGVYKSFGLSHIHAFLGDDEKDGRNTLMMKYIPFINILWIGLYLCVFSGILIVLNILIKKR